MVSAQQLISQYHLQPHPEGGWYKQTYKSSEYLLQQSLPKRFDGARAFSTAIYYLLEQQDFSAFHRIKSDECWHFYAGGALIIYVIQHNASLTTIYLGSDVEAGQMFQYVVPANCWFASRPAPGSPFCFVGCTVAPGFDFADFDLAEGQTLSALFPLHQDVVKDLTR